jgi:hypothetical protein
MTETQMFNRRLATIGWGALSVWWGISILVDPITIGMSAVGTGLILLGVNTVRHLKGIATYGSTTAVGIVALVWGALDHALALRFEPSLATLLIVTGVVTMASLLVREMRTANA